MFQTLLPQLSGASFISCCLHEHIVLPGSYAPSFSNTISATVYVSDTAATTFPLQPRCGVSMSTSYYQVLMHHRSRAQHNICHRLTFYQSNRLIGTIKSFLWAPGRNMPQYTTIKTFYLFVFKLRALLLVRIQHTLAKCPGFPHL